MKGLTSLSLIWFLTQYIDYKKNLRECFYNFSIYKSPPSGVTFTVHRFYNTISFFNCTDESVKEFANNIDNGSSL